VTAAILGRALFKVAYAFGLRRNEVRILGPGDFGSNAHATEFGTHRLCRRLAVLAEVHPRSGTAGCISNPCSEQLSGRRRQGGRISQRQRR
jgi:hypothetical protein